MVQSNKESRATFRMHEEDLENLKLLAAREGITQSQYLRYIIKNKKRVFTLSPDEVTNLKIQFANITRLGSNINQIAHHMNRRIISGKDEELITKEEKDLLLTLLDKAANEVDKNKRKIVKLINDHSG